MIPAGENGAVQFALGRIIGDAQEFGKHDLIHFFREGLAFVFAALAMAFEAMAENFVEENGGGAAGEKRGAVERLGDGRFAQRGEIFSHFWNAARDFGFGRKLIGRERLESFHAKEIHAIFGARFGLNHEADRRGRRYEAAAFRGNVGGFGFRNREDYQRRINFRIFAKFAGQAANAIGPVLFIEIEFRDAGVHVILRLLGGEVWRFVFLFGADGGVRFYFQECGRSFFVFAIGELPEDAGDRGGIIFERQRAGSDARGAAFGVGVVERGGADVHDHIGGAAMSAGGGDHRAVAGDDLNFVRVVGGVADEVGSGIGFRQIGFGAGQFFLHRGEQRLGI